MHSEVRKYCLENILQHISVIDIRFSKIGEPKDFVKNEQGLLLLDGIATRLQAIGENIKKLIKIYPEIIDKHQKVEWNLIVRFRDFISHHYEKLDYEIIFEICSFNIQKLKEVVELELNI